MRFSYYFLLFVSLLSITSARLRRMIPNEKRNEICKYNANKEHIYKWETKVYPNMPLDHFSYTNPTTFKLRYLINTESYGPNGPIFFYAGNEGPIEMFADATGIMWEWAQKYHGAVVFAEHRFYGKTLPFGAESFKTVENLGYLSSEQAIADFADLIVYLKEEGLGPKARESKVFVLGGSYGGMLAAWMRIKYPHLVSGALASSAPVLWFFDWTPPTIFDQIVTRSFVEFGGCNFESVQNAFRALDSLGETDAGRKFLNEQFHLAKESILETSDDVDGLKWFVRDAFETMAVVNYPYPTNYMGALPEYPVKIACEKFKKLVPSSGDKERAEVLYLIANMFYNNTGKATTFCVLDSCYSSEEYMDDGWPWQTCTEMVLPICGDGPPKDFFWMDCPVTIETTKEYCSKTYGKIGYNTSLLRPYWAIKEYGHDFASASNIIFSNGEFDPWSGGGWYPPKDYKGQLVNLIVKDGAHHYDLRGSHPKDTESVKQVRRIEEKYMKQWMGIP